MSNTTASQMSSDLRSMNAETLIDLMQAEKNSRGALIVVGRPMPTEGGNGDIQLRKVDQEIRLYGKLDNHWYIMVAKDVSNMIQGTEESLDPSRGESGTRRPIRGLNIKGYSPIPHWDSNWFPFKINTAYDFHWDCGAQGPADIKCWYTRTYSANVSATVPDQRISSSMSRAPGEFVIMINPYFSDYVDSGSKKEGVSFRYDLISKSLNVQIAEHRLLKYFNKTQNTFVEARPSSTRGASGFQDWLRIKVWK